MIHRVSLFRGARDNTPTPAEFTWQGFVEALLPHEFAPADSKLSCDAFSPAAFDGLRSNDNVLGLSLFVADLDGVTDEQVAAFVAAALDRGWAMLMHSTWRHHTDPNRLRAVLPLSREVSPDEWPDVWSAINDALGGLSDPKCKDPARLYFGAFAPDEPEARDAAFDHVFDGERVDVDALLGMPPTCPPNAPPDSGEPLPPVGGESVSREALERFATALRRKRDERSQERGVWLRQVCNGEAFAEPGSIDNTLFALSLVLAERWPEAAPDSIARHFGASLALMARNAPDYAMTVEQAGYKIRRAQLAIRERRQQEQADHDAAVERRIADAFGTDRSHPYTDEEIAGFPVHRWIIQKGRSYYTLVAGSYHGPYTQDEAQTAAVRDLAPAHTANVELFTINTQGERSVKPLARLVRDYGFVASDVAVSLNAQHAYFDEGTRTLVEAPSPLRKITPRFHAEIDAWLCALAGDNVHLLKAWIAAVTRLDVPCTALFLTGHKHTGKSVLPEGLSRLWSALGFPTPLEDVLGTNFNDAQLRCPLVFADERLPTDHRGRVLNAELRHYIQARRRPLRRKFMPNADMIGAVRLIISANNEEILATSENLSNHDIGAIVDRYLHIVCRVEAYHYLRDVDSSKWVEGDMIAEHALWLRDNNTFADNGRFLVHAEDNDLHSRLISSSGIRSAVLQFCVGYLLDPGPLDANARGQNWIRVNDGRLCVNTQALVRCWSLYVSNEHCPPTGRISSAIAALSTDERVRLNMPGGRRPNYRVIRPEHLTAWAAREGLATPDEIVEALSHNTEERAKHLAPN
jgi:hypothetical protein